MTVRRREPPAVGPESRPDRDLGWSLGVVLRAYHCTINGVVEEIPHGHRGYQVLAAVVCGDHPSQLALATHLGIDKTVMTYLIDDLAAAGLVERQPNPDDRRQRRIVATTAGRRVRVRVGRRLRLAEDEVLAGVDAADRKAFRALLIRVAESVATVGERVDACEVAAAVLDGASRS